MFLKKIFLAVVAISSLLLLTHWMRFKNRHTNKFTKYAPSDNFSHQLEQCEDIKLIPRIELRGKYYVIYNYVRATKRFKCSESITYTTHADYSFLDNLIPLVKQWQGPISLALHAPGTDFRKTMDSIAYLRDCTSKLIKEYVTFHIYYHGDHIPQEMTDQISLLDRPPNCKIPPPYLNVSPSEMYRSEKNLLYPVNVGRNAARISAQTHFVLPSDIELFPSKNLIQPFLSLVAQNKGPLLSRHPKVFPLNLFEIESNEEIPQNKTRLKEMLDKGVAIPFHKRICPRCHSIPKQQEWQAEPESKEMEIFHVAKRNKNFIHWEPIFIGTNAEPLYDERLSWEGKSDKMTQGYALCALDYDFLILNNAFLVHRPGIKSKKKDASRGVIVAKTKELIENVIMPELKNIYGDKKECQI